MKGIILASGYGKRLDDIRKQYVPKGLMLVKKKPIIEYTLDQLVECQNISEIIVITNKRGEEAYNSYLSTASLPKKCELIVEEISRPGENLGVCRTILYTINTIDDKSTDFAVFAQDNIFDRAGVNLLVSRYRSTGADIAIMTYKTKSRALATKSGVVVKDKNNKVVSFAEAPKTLEHDENEIFTFAFIMACKLVGSLRDFTEKEADIERLGHYLVSELNAGRNIYAATSKNWIDTGTPESYSEAQNLEWIVDTK